MNLELREQAKSQNGWDVKAERDLGDGIYLVIAKRPTPLLPHLDYIVTYYNPDNKGFFWSIYDLSEGTAYNIYKGILEKHEVI